MLEGKVALVTGVHAVLVEQLPLAWLKRGRCCCELCRK